MVRSLISIGCASMNNQDTWFCGLRLTNPIVVASGTVDYKVNPELAGVAGVVILKSLKEKATFGSPQPRMAEVIKDDILEIDSNYTLDDLADTIGLVNCIGLQGPGYKGFIDQYLPWYSHIFGRFMISIAGNSVNEYVNVLTGLRPFLGSFIAIEVNISCPNVEGGLAFGADPQLTFELISQLRKILSDKPKPMIVKLTPNVSERILLSVAGAAVGAGADALSLINTIKVTAQMRDGRTITGGLSGPIIFPIAQKLVWQVCNAFPKVPVIAGGGVFTAEQAKKMLDSGATLVSVGTLNFTRPDAVSNLIRDLESNN